MAERIEQQGKIADHGSAAGGRMPPGRPPTAGDRARGLGRRAERYGMAQLEAQTGLTARTIRFYITEGLLPPAYGRGPSATYDETHLLRLRAIQELKAKHLQLQEIKAHLADLGDDELATLVAVEAVPAEARGLWRRIELHPGVELHVREPTAEGRDLAFEQKVSALVGAARGILAQPGGER